MEYGVRRTEYGGHERNRQVVPQRAEYLVPGVDEVSSTENVVLITRCSEVLSTNRGPAYQVPSITEVPCKYYGYREGSAEDETKPART
jgi:hypothetical protein